MKLTTLGAIAIFFLILLQTNNIYSESRIERRGISILIIESLDKNHNRKIEITEIIPPWNEAFDDADETGDRKLTINEFKPMITRFHKNFKEIIDIIDFPPSCYKLTNEDTTYNVKLDCWISKAFKELDNNNDDEITILEFENHISNRFFQIDTNDDKMVGMKELIAAPGRLYL